MVPSDSQQLETLPGREGDGDSVDSLEDPESDAVLRAIAHAPPRRVPYTVTPGMRWGAGDRYIIDRLLGRGGMGAVYAATDSVLGRPVALKVLDLPPGQDGAHAPVLREAQLAARVEDERIARVYDVGTHDGFAFVALEYIQGGTLRQWMNGKPMALHRLLDVALQIAEGLTALHKHGIIHRDLKPENVGMTQQGGVKLLDFGLARYAVRPNEDIGLPPRAGLVPGTTIAAASGTPGYMAPEQYENKPVDARVDVFAFGVILHELVTGDRMFPGATMTTIMQATLAWSPSLTGAPWDELPDGLRELVTRMLARSPDDRYADGAAVLAALRKFAASLPPSAVALDLAPTEPIVPALPRKIWKQIAARGIELGCAAAAVAFFVVQSVHHGAPTPPPGMAYIDVGTIQVGRNLDEVISDCVGIGDKCDRYWIEQSMFEVPRQTVTVKPFFIDRDEVTNTEFADWLKGSRTVFVVKIDPKTNEPRFVHENSGLNSDKPLAQVSQKFGHINYDVAVRSYSVDAGAGQLPATYVSWYGAQKFCESRGKRLPTDEEWEAAARGRNDRLFPWGNQQPDCTAVAIPADGEVLMSGACPYAHRGSMRPVGAAPQDVTPDGVHDLGGNVTEWTASMFVRGERHPSTTGLPPNTGRVTRGGSWAESLGVHSSDRNYYDPSLAGANIGFRCVFDVPNR